MSNPTENLRCFLAINTDHEVSLTARRYEQGGGWTATLWHSLRNERLSDTHYGLTPNDAVDQLAGDDQVFELTKGY